jgi:hypothetical protein
VNHDFFSRAWDVNYHIVTIGELLLGVSHGRPVQWLLHWKTVKLVCDDICEKLGQSKDEMDFRPFQFMGDNNKEYPRWKENYIPDIISVLEWYRWNTRNSQTGHVCPEQMIAFRITLARER